MNATQSIEWSTLLQKAVTEPGVISAAYRRFWNYSTGNQMLAMFQCALRSIELGPIHTFNGWKELGRFVRKGEKAIELIMPVTCKSKERKTPDGEPEKFTMFVARRNWFCLSQTDGAGYQPVAMPEWNEATALTALNICRVNFTSTNGNCQGYAIGRMVAVSPLADLPHKTMFHELAHVILGHTAENQMNDGKETPRDIRELEAESVAMLVCESLGLAGADHCRGYIQNWYRGDSIPESSARKIFSAADAILKAGRTKSE